MKTKIMSLFLTVLMLTSIVPLASATDIAAFAYWIDTTGENLTVMQGDIPQLGIYVESYADAINVDVDLLTENNNPVRNLLKVTNYRNGNYYNLLDLNTIDLAGNYKVVLNVNSNGSQDVVILTLNVQPAVDNNNEPQIDSAPVIEVNENELYSYTLHASDVDGDQLSYTFIQKPSWINGNQLDNEIFEINGIAPEVETDRNHVVTVEVSDGLEFTRQTFVITIKDTDNPITPPPETSVAVLLSWQGTTGINHSILLGESAEFQYSVESINENYVDLELDLLRNGVLYKDNFVDTRLSSGSVNGFYNLNQELSEAGIYTVEAKVTGASGNVDTESIILIVEDLGAMNPVMNTLDNGNVQTVNEGETLIFDVSALDPRNNGLTFSAYVGTINNPYQDVGISIFDRFRGLINKLFRNNINEINYNFDTQTGRFTFSPDYEFVEHPNMDRSFTVNFRAFDGVSYSAWMPVEVIVDDVNRLPELTYNGATSFSETEQLSVTIIGNDADNEDSLVFNFENLPSWVSINNLGNEITLTGTPGCQNSGDYPFTVVVTDGYSVVSETYTWSIVDSCTIDLPGCTDPDATNYDQTATVDDGTCTFGALPSELASLGDVYFKKVHLLNEDLTAGEYLEMSLTIANGGDADFENLRVKVTAPELSQQVTSGKFNLDSRDEEQLHLVMEIPYFGQPGRYLLKFTISDDHYHESTYREVTIN